MTNQEQQLNIQPGRERAELFDEGVTMDQQTRLRRIRLDLIKTQKLHQLRFVNSVISIDYSLSRGGVSEKYCADIERKVHRNIHVNNQPVHKNYLF